MLSFKVICEMRKKSVERAILMEAIYVVNPNPTTKQEFHIAKKVAEQWQIVFERHLFQLN